MAEIDPVILQLRADLGKYQADVGRVTRLVENQLGRQERSAQKLEAQLRKSSGAISTSIKGIAGALGVGLGAQELVSLSDSFTRLQNNLRVAGLEGENFARVQKDLLQISQQYGVDVEALSSVFLKASLAQNELGASTGEIIRLNQIVAASLKITGTSTEQARGALLQLGQALGSDVVRGEEFNSLLENALPIVQAAANGIERYGGSVAKLRKDVVDGKITSQEFFEGVLRGGVDTINQAEKATLTLSGGFNALTSSLTVYAGEADKSLGSSAALGAALKAIADNLHILIPAIAVVATAMGANLLVNTVAASTAFRVLVAHVSIATTSMAGLRLAAASAGSALFAINPVIAIVGALGVAIALAANSARGAEAATGSYKTELEASRKASDTAREAAERLANARGKTREEALQAAKAERELTVQKLASAKASLQQARAELARAQAFQSAQNSASFGAGGVPGTATFIQGEGDKKVATAQSNLAAANERIKNLQAAINAIDTAINPAPTIVAPSDDKKKRGRQGPTLEEIQQRFNSELISLSQQALSAQIAQTTSAEERAELELRSVELARLQAIEEINANKDYNATQKARLVQAVEVLATEERAAIEKDKQAQLEREASDLLDEQNRIEQEALRQQFDLARTQKERRQIALELIDLDYRYRKASLDAIIASESTSEAEKERARLALQALQRARQRDENAALEDTAGPLEEYLNRLPKTQAEINEKIEGFQVDALKELNSGLADAIVNGGKLGDVLEDTGKRFLAQLIEIALQLLFIKPLLEGLSGGGGGGFFGFGLGNTPGIASIFGKAGGGPVQAGQLYRVNEANQEFFRPDSSGQIIPLGQMNAIASRQQPQQMNGVIQITLSEDLDGRIVSMATPVAVEIVRQAAGPISDLGAEKAIARSERPRL